MFKKSSNAPTIFGRRRLRSSAALHSYQMKKMVESEALLSLQAAALLDALRRMEPKSTTSPASAPKSPKQYAQQWSGATPSSPSSASESPMSSEECSGPPLYLVRVNT